MFVCSCIHLFGRGEWLDVIQNSYPIIFFGLTLLWCVCTFTGDRLLKLLKYIRYGLLVTAYVPAYVRGCVHAYASINVVVTIEIGRPAARFRRRFDWSFSTYYGITEPRNRHVSVVVVLVHTHIYIHTQPLILQHRDTKKQRRIKKKMRNNVSSYA